MARNVFGAGVPGIGEGGRSGARRAVCPARRGRAVPRARCRFCDRRPPRGRFLADGAGGAAVTAPELDLAGDPAGHRIVVAMSGGVDSSVAAALLAEQGFEVVGITLQLYDHGATTGRAGACCAGRDIYDAARVAEQLGIAHYVLDYESRFRAAVIDDFVESY